MAYNRCCMPVYRVDQGVQVVEQFARATEVSPEVFGRGTSMNTRTIRRDDTLYNIPEARLNNPDVFVGGPLPLSSQGFEYCKYESLINDSVRKDTEIQEEIARKGFGRIFTEQMREVRKSSKRKYEAPLPARQPSKKADKKKPRPVVVIESKSEAFDPFDYVGEPEFINFPSILDDIEVTDTTKLGESTENDSGGKRKRSPWSFKERRLLLTKYTEMKNNSTDAEIAYAFQTSSKRRRSVNSILNVLSQIKSDTENLHCEEIPVTQPTKKRKSIQIKKSKKAKRKKEVLSAHDLVKLPRVGLLKFL